MSTNIADLLDGLELFTDFSYPELKSISKYLGYQGYKQGDVIFEEGAAGSFMLILVEGRLSVFKGGENGQHLLSYEGKGRVVGEMALLDHERRSATCMADTECILLILTHEGLDMLAQEHAALAYRLMLALARLLSRRLRRTSGILVEHLAQ